MPFHSLAISRSGNTFSESVDRNAARFFTALSRVFFSAGSQQRTANLSLLAYLTMQGICPEAGRQEWTQQT
jgi:hypothetical protein